MQPEVTRDEMACDDVTFGRQSPWLVSPLLHQQELFLRDLRHCYMLLEEGR